MNENVKKLLGILFGDSSSIIEKLNSETLITEDDVTEIVNDLKDNYVANNYKKTFEENGSKQLLGRIMDQIRSTLKRNGFNEDDLKDKSETQLLKMVDEIRKDNKGTNIDAELQNLKQQYEEEKTTLASERDGYKSKYDELISKQEKEKNHNELYSAYEKYAKEKNLKAHTIEYFKRILLEAEINGDTFKVSSNGNSINIYDKDGVMKTNNTKAINVLDGVFEHAKSNDLVVDSIPPKTTTKVESGDGKQEPSVSNYRKAMSEALQD